MELIVLGSSSRGNGYVLRASSGKSVVIEAGVPFVKVLAAVGYDRSNIECCCISHRHSDHGGYAGKYGRFPKVSCEETGGAEVLQPYKAVRYGGFVIYPFEVTHDVPNYGYIIKHKEIGSLLFATDCMHIPTPFRGIRHFLIEANYSDKMLYLSDTNNIQKRRIQDSHMSLEACMDYIERCGTEKADSITLIHLSSRHSDSGQFTRAIEGRFGITCNIAHKDTIIKL